MYSTLAELWKNQGSGAKVQDFNYASKHDPQVYTLVKGPDSKGKVIVVDSFGRYQVRSGTLRCWKVVC